MNIEKTKVAIIWIAIMIGLIILSPILLIIGILFAGHALIVELTQEYRCMRCGKWIPKEKRTEGEIVHWCSKECYKDD